MLRLNVLPWPGLLRTTISPPSISAIRLLIAKPRPVPPKRRVDRIVRLGKWPEQQAHLFLRHANARVDHVEYQLTAHSRTSGSSRMTTRTLPTSVNLMALPIMLTRICRRRIGSVVILSGMSPRTSSVSGNPFASARTFINEMTSVAIWLGEHSWRSTVHLPASIFERSSMSLMMFRRCSAVAFDDLGRFDGFLRCQVLQEDIGESQDCRHWGANLMAHVRQELALGPVGGFGSLFRFAASALSRASSSL